MYATVPGWYEFCFQTGFEGPASDYIGTRAGGVAKNGASNWVGFHLGRTSATVTGGCAVYGGVGSVYLNGTSDYLTLYQFKLTGSSGDIHTAYLERCRQPQLGIWWAGRDLT